MAAAAPGVVFLRFMYPGEDPPFAPLVWRLGVGLSSALLLLFLLTRTLPLPFPTFQGLALLAPAPLDPLSLLMAAPEPFLLGLLWRARP